MAVAQVPAQIRTYGDLKNAVTLWLDRDDDEFVSQIPNFINFAEKEIYRQLRMPGLEREIYLKIDNGMAHVPTDMLEVKYIMRARDGKVARVTSPEELDMRRTDNASHDKFNENEVMFTRTVGRFYFYPSISTNVPDIMNRGTLDGSEYLLAYWADQPEYTDDSQTNALLTLAPSLILYQALKHACLFVQDDEGAQKWGYMAQAVLAELDQQNRKMEYSGSPLAIPNEPVYNGGHTRIRYSGRYY